MYHHYKPLRNFVRQLDRATALLQIFRFYQNIQYAQELPPEFCRLNPKGICSIKDIVFPWELDVLAREVILHSGFNGSKNLFRVKDFVTAIGHIRRIQDRQIEGRLPEVIFQELHRLFQQQFPWQTKSVELRLCRYLRIYRTPEVESLLQQQTGLTVRKFYLLGGAVAGAFLSGNSYDLNTNFTQFGITNEQRDSFFRLVSWDMDNLRERTKSVQEYNENWSYTINPLRRTPLVSISKQTPNIVICPIPEFMLLRISEGLFFDMVEVKGFENPYGTAFERYVGEISSELITSENIKIEPGEEYFVKKNKKDGVDWYLFDDDAALLVECKAKGMKLSARYQLDEESLVKEIGVLAKAIVQNYKNLADIVSGFTKWTHGGRKLYPIVVTLSNWYLFGPSTFKRLEDAILNELHKARIDKEVLEKYPYTIMSVEEYEIAIQVASQVGLSEFFEALNRSEHKGWMVSPFMEVKYPNEISGARRDYLRSEVKSIIKYMEAKL